MEKFIDYKESIVDMISEYKEDGIFEDLELSQIEGCETFTEIAEILVDNEIWQLEDVACQARRCEEE